VRFIVAYDIADNDARSRVAALLGRHGIRLQRSVFDVELEPEEVDEMIASVERLIDLDVDVVDVFGTCSACEDRRWHIGQSSGTVMGSLWWVV
jgi:CRISPR-associated endonuclease Cas2